MRLILIWPILEADIRKKHSPGKNISPVDLYLISEKSIWKNPVRQTGILFYFELDFYSLSKLIFTTWFFKNQVQINRGVAFLENLKARKLLLIFAWSFFWLKMLTYCFRARELQITDSKYLYNHWHSKFSSSFNLLKSPK